MEDIGQISSTTPDLDVSKLQEDVMRNIDKFYTTESPDDSEAVAKVVDDMEEPTEKHKESMPSFEEPPSDGLSECDPFDSKLLPTLVSEAPLLDAGASLGNSSAKQTKTEETAGIVVKPETPKVESASKEKAPTSQPPYEPLFPPPAPTQPLVPPSAESSTQLLLGQEGDASRLGSVALASSLSPLHSPDSLEELSLSESPNQAPFMTMPFGSCPVPASEPPQKPARDVPLNEELKLFECKTESDSPVVRMGLGCYDEGILRGQDKDGVMEANCPPFDSDPLLSSFTASKIDLGSKVDLGKSMHCEDSGVASSPDEKLGSSVGSHDDGKINIDSDKEGFDKDSESGESTGSTPTQSPINSKITAEPFTSRASSNPAANLDAPHFDSQENFKAMDETSENLFSSKTSWYETNLLTSKAGLDDDDDDFLHEIKTSQAITNPFQGFAPIGDSGPGLSQFESASEMSAVKVCDSPSPDLVQHAHDGELQDFVTQTKHKEETPIDLVQIASDSVMEPSVPSIRSTLGKEPEESPAPPSLPDILKSSPLNPEKLDSGSSEGSPDYEQSLKHELRMEAQTTPGSRSTTSPLAEIFDAKISLLKEMAEETEAWEAEMRLNNVEETLETSFGAFDLVKEAQTTTKDNSPLEVKNKDWMFSSQELAQFVDKAESFNPLTSVNLPKSPPTKTEAEESSDSESPMTDSLSPVLEAMAKNPASFQIESKCVKDSKTSPVKVVADFEESRAYVEEPEASEQEVSSEEFEFIEKPPKGVMDEFLETLDNSKFAKAPEMGTDDDISPNFSQGELGAGVESELQEVGSHQSSYLLLTGPTSTTPPQKLKAELENPTEDLAPQAAAPLSHTPLTHFTTEEPEKPAHPQKMAEEYTGTAAAHPEGPKAARLPKLSTEAVVDLLYWRDVKTTGVVFGASLFLLLSLTTCSIVSVCSYVALALLSVTITFRIYKGILQAIQKSDEGHPFKVYLEQDVAVSPDLVHKYSDVALTHLNKALNELRRLFLVEDLVDSLKFAVLMWILTYVGALFNGLTLLILGLVAVFCCPIIYERHQAQIDHYMALVKGHVKDILGKIQAKVPGMKPKTE